MNDIFTGDEAAPAITRREFIKATATGLVILIAVDPVEALQEGARPARQGYPTDINAYLHIAPDNRVTCYVGKVELGQGTMTSLGQLLAEELDVAPASVKVVMGDTDLCPWDMGTFGSLSIRQFGPVLRQAGADARATLLAMAAARLGAPVERLKVDAGVVSDTADGTKKVTYGQLTAGQRIERTVTTKASVKPVAAFTVVGKSLARVDGIDKVTGRAAYAGDIVPPGGALHARVLRPPSHFATLVSVDAGAAERRPGVTVIRDGDLIAVLHAHRDEADAALALVKANWTRNDPPLDETTIFDHLVKTAPAPRTSAEAGSLADGERLAARVIEHTYYDSYFAHAPMEPHAAVAAVESGKVTVWAGTQTPFSLKTQVMQALKLPADKVRVITPYVGGGFGGKSASGQGVEAARLAVITGKPVRVLWSRDEEFFYDTFRPASVITIRSGMDAGNSVVSWDYLVYAAGDRGAAHFYDIPNHRTVTRGGWGGSPAAGFHPFAVGPWRAPGASTNAFARESQIDVMAATAKADPVEFRMRHLADKRMRRVLEAAASKFGWKPAALPSGRGFGVACGIDAGTCVALIVEAAVNKGTGAVRVKRMVCAQEMGVVVNPDGALQQVEGCLTMGLGYALSEDLRFRGGEVLTKNFDSYEIPRFSSVPLIEVTILDAPETPAQGGGEPAIAPVGAAVANAIFDATGARLYQMPMTPARVKEALAAVRSSLSAVR
jgi:nicotinate dehydrogenase subunit B